eukprot:3246077-Pleurochrysis_carterae.AAC.4
MQFMPGAQHTTIFCFADIQREFQAAQACLEHVERPHHSYARVTVTVPPGALAWPRSRRLPR